MELEKSQLEMQQSPRHKQQKAHRLWLLWQSSSPHLQMKPLELRVILHRYISHLRFVVWSPIHPQKALPQSINRFAQVQVPRLYQ